MQEVYGGNYIGAGILKNCYNRGEVIGNSPGGIIGTMYGGNQVANCYNIGKIENIVEGGSSAGIIAAMGYCPNVDVTTLYYLEKSATSFTGKNKKNPNTKEYMQSQEFVDELNKYVDENSTEEIVLSRWEYNEGEYPTFE